jgi:hypothetical protein
MGAATGGKWSLTEGIDLCHLTEEGVEALYALGKEVIIFALLQLSMIATRGGAAAVGAEEEEVEVITGNGEEEGEDEGEE